MPKWARSIELNNIYKIGITNIYIDIFRNLKINSVCNLNYIMDMFYLKFK